MRILLLLIAASIAMPAQSQVTQSARSQARQLSIRPANATDSQAPVITVAEPQKLRGISLKRKAPELKVRARVTDESPITLVTVNDVAMTLTVDGWFETSLPLLLGANSVVILAEDAAGNFSTEVIPVEREPEIEIRGRYVALVIGIDEYSGLWPKLDNAVRDAEALAAVLRDDYQFDEVITLINAEATREGIILRVEALADELEEEDNLLVYYSGHGQLDQRFNRGYWVPVDAESASTSEFIANTEVQTWLRGFKARHTLLIADACFAGDLFRAGPALMREFKGTPAYYQSMHDKKSRKALTSGGVQPVMDGGAEGHSVFAFYLLKALRENRKPYLDASELFDAVDLPVRNNSDEQTPLFSPIKNSGDEGGQFVFVK
jgi:Caspase domain/Glucodextranase, domain B